MRTRADYVSMSPRELNELFLGGHPIDPAALDESRYRGVSVGLPAPIIALTWRTFEKTFHRDPTTGRLRGWNVRLEQTGLDAPAVPRFTFGHYEVVPADPKKSPRPIAEGALLIDYSRAPGSRLDPARGARDVIVAIERGSVQQLLGWMYMELGPARIPTPSYFLLDREGPLESVISPG